MRGTHRENVAVGKDGIALRGDGALLLPPAAPATNACFDPTDPDEVIHGICVSGDVDFESGEVSRYVKRVSVSGLTVRGFTGNGITTAAARDATLSGNVAEGNRDGGIGAIASTGVRVVANRTAGNRFGIYVGSSTGGSIAANSIHDNCVGVAVVAAPDGVPAERNRVAGNVIRGNDPDVFWDGSGSGYVIRGGA